MRTRTRHQRRALNACVTVDERIDIRRTFAESENARGLGGIEMGYDDVVASVFATFGDVVTSVLGAIGGFVAFVGGLAGTALTILLLRNELDRRQKVHKSQRASLTGPASMLETTHTKPQSSASPALRPPGSGRPARAARPRTSISPEPQSPRTEHLPSRPAVEPPAGRPAVETALLAWVGGVFVAAIASYFGARLAHGVLVTFVVNQFDNIEMPPLGNFTPPLTWMACAVVVAIVLGVAVGVQYKYFETKVGTLIVFSLAGLLALPEAFVGIAASETLGWAAWHYFNFSFALGAWLALAILGVIAASVASWVVVAL